MKQLIFLLCAVLFCSVAFADKPAIIWYSAPVKPGEAIMVFGGPWQNVNRIELSGPEKKFIKPLKVTPDYVTFMYPEKWPLAAFDAKIIDKVSGSVTIRVNAPEAWWYQGNLGKEASPGSWLTIFGRCIGYNNQASVEFRSHDKKVITTVAVKSNLYAAKVIIPKDLSPGDYRIYLNNGLDKDFIFVGGITLTRKLTYRKKIFNIIDYGAVPNDRIDDSRAINAAVKAIAKNRGGVLFIPRGRFGMQGEIRLPVNSVLRGAGMSLSQIYWVDKDYPSKALVSGKYNFGIENISLVSGNYYHGIAVTQPEKGDSWKNENISLHKVRINFLHTDPINTAEGMRRASQKAAILELHGQNILLEGCDITATKGEMHLSGNYLLIRDNHIFGASKNQSMTFQGQKIVIENNDLRGTSCSFINNSRYCYLYHNQLGNIFGDGDRETFTFDGGGGTYNNGLLSASGRRVKLKNFKWRHGKKHWIGRSIYIIGGKGAGQMRFITATGKNEVTIDRDWDIIPDNTSHLVIANTRYKLLFIDNSVYDGNPFQLYGSAINCILAGNKLYRNGGLQAYGMQKGGIPEPSWFIQFLGNEIMEGNAVRGPFSYIVPANDSYLAFFDRGIHKPLTYPEARVGIMRKNRLHNNAYIYVGPRVKDALVENNLVKNSDRGVVVGTDTAILRGNRFENVVEPYEVNSKIYIGNAAAVLAALQAAKTTLRKFLPANWQDFSRQVKKNPQKAKQILETALRELSSRVGDNEISSKTVRALTGLDMSQKTPWFFSSLKSGRQSKLYLNSPYPSWAIPAKLTAEPDSFDGWKMKIVCPQQLVPGKNVAAALYITPGQDLNSPFFLPVRYTISGKGWSFTFKKY